MSEVPLYSERARRRGAGVWYLGSKGTYGGKVMRRPKWMHLRGLSESTLDAS